MSPSKKKPLRIALVLVVLAVAAGVGWKLRHEEGPDDVVTFHGNVDIRDVTLAFRVGGRVERVDKNEGDRVEPGELLARLDAAPHRVALERAEAAVEVAEAQLARVVAGSRREDIAEARAVVAQRRAALKRAQDTRDRYARLAETGAVTEQAFSDSETSVEQAEAALRAAEAALQRAVDGSRAEDVAVARAQVSEAKAALAAAQLNLDDTELRASTAGTLVTRAIDPGAVVSPGSPALVISFEDPAWVRAFATEPQLGKLAPGTPVDVYTDSRPGEPYRGQIGYVSPQAEFTPKNVETAELRTSLVYRFRVVVSKHEGGLRQGMPVTVKLLDAGAPQSAASKQPGS